MHENKYFVLLINCIKFALVFFKLHFFKLKIHINFGSRTNVTLIIDAYDTYRLCKQHIREKYN